MRILLVGLGSIGLRHLRLLQEREPVASLAVVSARELPQEFSNLTRFPTLTQAVQWEPTLTLVTNPAPKHVETALEFGRCGSHLFIEKPLSNTLSGVDELLALCAKKNLVCMVGYMLRFFEPLVVMKQALEQGKVGKVFSISASVGQYLPDWRAGRDYRQTVSATEALGGGVLLELSHELDYVRWLLGEIESVRATTARVSDLEIDVEDSAEITLTFANGAVGQIHLDMLDRAAHRDCRIVGSAGTLLWQSEQGHRVQLRSTENSDWVDLRAAGAIDPDRMYRAQLDHLFACIEGKQQPMVSGEVGRRVLELVLAAKQSGETHARQNV